MTVTIGERVERTITVQGIETHLFEAGPRDAPPLLYLHGTSLGNLWLDYHTALAQRFQLVAPDIPGFGLTARPDWMRDMSDYILYLRDLLDTLGMHRPFVVGHSLGGWMAAELAVWYPERVGKLVLSNAAGIRVKGSPIADIFAMNAQETVAACFEDPLAALPLLTDEPEIELYARTYRERTTLASLAWNPHYDPKLERRLAWVQCPTLIVWGSTDRLIPPIYGETFQRLVPGAELIVLDGVGHIPMFERQLEWSTAITRFLDGTSR